MVGLVPTIHVFIRRARGQDVDARHKGEHDAVAQRPISPSHTGKLTSALMKITQ
jgi:hypothetical protein